MGVTSPETFADRFSELLGRRTFRLELLDFYVAENERDPYRRFLAGQPQDLTWREPWKRLVGSARAKGKAMERAHVVTEPLTDYMRFTLTCGYPSNVDAGEDVRILPRARAFALDLPDTDYWLFDEDLVAVMTYDETGNWLSVELTDDPSTVEQAVHGRDIIMEHATPLMAYLANTTTEDRNEARRSA